ncbi:MAG: amidase domain-containing protein [Candidatus Cohnella colombiensis]|uniref:Amidase domain-containing protein n=1 Tax=Candidatus Cohnella colombiensis TaxID=3121368 RepID=A0AA95F2N6_9BACL|nr:MAG: amidase domain-containing protein [Cohnella sp.]
MGDQKEISAEWKAIIFDYVSRMNEVMLNRSVEMLVGLTDFEQQKRIERCLKALGERELREGIKPVRSEMRARIERIQLVRGELLTDLAVHQIRTFEQRNLTWTEEKIERERVGFIRSGRDWRISRVRVLVDEAMLAATWHQQMQEVPLDEEENLKTQSIPRPYMNPQAVHGFKSRLWPGVGNSEDYRWDEIGRRSEYRREEVVAYAERWWNEPNPSYENFEVNCTNYVSQCIFAGGAPMNYTGRRDLGWWYRGQLNKQEHWSYSWAVANSLQKLLSQPRGYGLRAQNVERPEQLRLGDVICYDWDGNGRFGHNTIVTAFTPEGMPLVNANTVSSRHRFWDYRDSYAWTEQTRYKFFHITDEF